MEKIDDKIVEQNVGTGLAKDDYADPVQLFMKFFQTESIDALLNEKSTPESALNSSLSASGQALSNEQLLRSSVLTEGISVIERISSTTSKVSKTDLNDRHKDLRFDSISLSNFGPYGGTTAVTYPLSRRGLVLLTGKSMDGTGADSNGAGKVCYSFSLSQE
jgi:hypothetical protein